PGCVEVAAVSEASNDVAVGVKDGDITEAGTMVFVVGSGKAVRKRDHDVAADILDSKGRIVRRQHAVHKCSRRHGDGMEAAVEDVHVATLEVGGVQARPVRALGYRQSFVNCAAGIVDLEARVERVKTRIP